MICIIVQIARSSCLHIVVMWVLISFAIVPKVFISSLVVQKYISCDFGEMLQECALGSFRVLHFYQHKIYVVPPQSWGDRSDTKHSKCLLLGGRRLNQLTLIPKPKGSGGARAATAQVGPANKRNDTKRCLPIEASLRPWEAVPW